MTQAVQEAYAAIPATSPAMPTLYLDAIPEDVNEFKGAYFKHEGETVKTYHTGIVKPTEIEGKFTIHFFSTSAVQVETWCSALKAALAPNPSVATPGTHVALQLTGGQTCITKRTNYVFEDTKQRSITGDHIYTARQSYVCQIGGPL